MIIDFEVPCRNNKDPSRQDTKKLGKLLRTSRPCILIVGCVDVLTHDCITATTISPE